MLVRNSGQELKGKVLKIDEKSVTFSSDNGESVFFKDDILRLEFTKDTTSESTIPLSDINDEALKNAIAKKIDASKYTNAGYINLLYELQYTYKEDGSFETRRRQITKVLKERGKDAGIVHFSYKDGLQTAKILYGR
ncbi:hypothetical protein ACFL2A_07050, partial [Thermodesulfobacteriota bacterium]